METVDVMSLYFVDRNETKPTRTGQYLCINDRGAFYVICYDADSGQWFYDTSKSYGYYELNCAKWAAIPYSMKTAVMDCDMPAWVKTNPNSYTPDMIDRCGNGG